jgi:hypothetical protein
MDYGARGCRRTARPAASSRAPGWVEPDLKGACVGTYGSVEPRRAMFRVGETTPAYHDKREGVVAAVADVQRRAKAIDVGCEVAGTVQR